MARPDAALEELAGVPPREFTRARNALATRLTQAGDKAAASRVKKLRAPTVPVWVVNRLAREGGNLVIELLAAAQRVRSAQLGHGGAAPLAAASREHGEAVRGLLARADRLLDEAGIQPTHAIRQ